MNKMKSKRTKTKVKHWVPKPNNTKEWMRKTDLKTEDAFYFSEMTAIQKAAWCSRKS